jgi:hypothetical protein
VGLVATQQGCAALWQQLWGIESIGLPNVHLVGQPHQAAATDTYASYAAVELIAGGYAPKSLVNPAVDWSIAPVPNGAQASYITLSWSLTTACTVYGYWIADQANQRALWGETFAAPFVLPSNFLFSLQLPPTLTS